MFMTKFTTVVVLANPPPIKYQTILFNANFYVSSTEIIVAALHFYNVKDLTFDDITKVVLCASVNSIFSIMIHFSNYTHSTFKVSKMPEQIITDNESLFDTEYDLTSDIVQVSVY
ncbi:hypothetical protein GYMLUDRAFT_59237 [Collybiopsis luxurians FD-317 M1]|uniref:Uncharacterized protein n=1 Tax=Collybiopsis luxurians FD-317 M1 TaxID=944289 RepID=A0A0D0CX90_9AGAR|nr:hypothetical protein GYMLUDRAFT_59237 [Collybiopsis luxurians FD-317 M1]